MHGSYLWTDAALAVLDSLFKSGATASQIRVKLPSHNGVLPTRNAVCGKLHRRGLLRGKPAGPRGPRAPREPRPPRKPTFNFSKQKGTRPRLPREPHKPRLSLRKFNEAIPVDQRKSLLQLNGHTCRWPVGDPGTPGFFFCGGMPTTAKSAYCSEHERFGLSKHELAHALPKPT